MATAVKDAAWRRAHARRRRKRVSGTLRRVREAEATWLVALALLCALVALLAAREIVPVSMFVVPVLLGGVTLSMSRLLWLLGIVALAIVLVLLALGTDAVQFVVLRVGALSVVAVTALIMVWSTRSRSRLGVAGTRGETMLVDLRDRLQTQGVMPELPSPWYAEVVMRSAGGASFAGDFMVSAKAPDESVLELVVVDVSGKGLGAGTRALQLSGAFGGLIGSVPPEQFLPAANAYLLRQDWREGFATAVYLVLDLRTGEYEVRTAGHPPAVQLHAGSGRWQVQSSEGPVLGLMDRAEFVAVRGRVQPGDALLLYTDGLVETPQRDLSMGIDKLLGEAERLATHGFERGASRLVERIASQNDDRALALLHRRTGG